MSLIEFVEHGASGLPSELLLDTKWYAERYLRGARLADGEIQRLYLDRGLQADHAPSPYVLPSLLRAKMRNAGLEPGEDLRALYLQNCDRFDPHFLLPRTPVGFVPDSPLKAGIAEEWYNFSVYILRVLDSPDIRHSLFFDPSYITDDTGAQAERPLEYYLRHLAHTEHQTSALFVPDFYAATYPELRQAVGSKAEFISMLHHFVCYGMREGKVPIPDFDPDFYMAQNPDLQAPVDQKQVSAIEHFLTHGIGEGRDPNPYFNTRYYLDHQPDVAEAVRREKLQGPFEHFLKFGSKLGYRANAPLHAVQVPERFGKALYEKRCRLAMVNLIRTRDTITFPDPGSDPKLSCIIPVVNQGHMTLNLLRQLSDIAWRRDMPAIEVIVVDNGSSDVTVELERLTDNVRVLRSPDPLGYPAACNLGASAAKGRFLLMMNNDIELSTEAVRRGISRLEDGPDIGAVGGRLVLMNGQMQEAGSYLGDDGGSLGLGRHADPDALHLNTLREVDYCSGCFLFVRKADFDALGGYDDAFSPGYYEEVDLCMRLRARGLKSVFDPGIVVHHYEYASYSTGRPPSVSSALMLRNRAKILQRYRKELSQLPQIHSPAWQARLAQARLGAARNIALVEDRIPDRGLGSGFARSADLVESLLDAGHNVTLFALHYQPGVFAETLSQRGVEIVPCYAPGSAPNPLQGRAWDFDIVWICRTHNITRWSGIVRQARRQNPALRMVYDTEAIVALRDAHYMRLHAAEVPPDTGRDIAEELCVDGPALPDAIVTVNGTDQDATAALDMAPVFRLGHKMTAGTAAPGPKDRTGLFFCGAFHERISPNYDSMEWFLASVWPRLRRDRPDLTLTIAGHCAPGVPLERLVTRSAGVRFLGRVPDLRPHFDTARVFVAPTRYAGGIPHKVDEAMNAGLPVVCTDLLRRQLSTETIGFDDVPALSADALDPAGFAAACLTLLEDDALWHRQQTAGVQFIRQTASAEIFDTNLSEILSAL